MSAICIIDTTVFCNILGVPNKSQHREVTLDTLKEYIESGAILLLPMATIYETGNHIGQNGDGRQRRQMAKRFAFQVQEAMKGNAPWTPTPMDTIEELSQWLNDFPDWVMGNSGLGDLSILQIFHKQCALFAARDVFIWSYDEHLSSYSRPAII